MKIKAIKSLCEGAGHMKLLTEMDDGGEFRGQWIGNGQCLYAVEGLPPMEAEHICAMFDWGEKRLEKMNIEDGMLPEELDLMYNVTDAQLEEMDVRLTVGGREYRLYEEPGRVYFVEDKLLNPVKDEIDKITVVRRAEGRLLVLRGLIVVGMVVPTLLPCAKQMQKVLCELQRYKAD